jgi:Ran GTPase-activating protein (RanGAP) involved in mRNA processing and transport
MPNSLRDDDENQKTDIVNLSHFSCLGKLQIPVDFLLGANPNKHHNISTLLPSSLEELRLDDCLHTSPGGVRQWNDTQIFSAFSNGLISLQAGCSMLRRIKIKFLEEFSTEVSTGFDEFVKVAGKAYSWDIERGISAREMYEIRMKEVEEEEANSGDTILEGGDEVEEGDEEEEEEEEGDVASQTRRTSATLRLGSRLRRYPGSI